MPKIEPFKESGHRTGSLSHKLTVEEINKRLGFEPNIDDDPCKVQYSWGFLIDGEHCAIWDYKGSRWSTYGPAHKLASVFLEYIEIDFDVAEAVIHDLITNEDRIKIAQIVRNSATDALGDEPDGGFLDDVIRESNNIMASRPHDWSIVIETYLDVILGDAETPTEYINKHRKLMEK